MMIFLKEVKFVHDNIEGMNWWRAFRLVWELNTKETDYSGEEEE